MAEVAFDFHKLPELKVDDDFREWFQDRLIGELAQWRSKETWTLVVEPLRRNAKILSKLVWDPEKKTITIRVNTHEEYPETRKVKVYGHAKRNIEFRHWREPLIHSAGCWYAFARWSSTSVPKANRHGLRWLQDWLEYSETGERRKVVGDVLQEFERG